MTASFEVRGVVMPMLMQVPGKKVFRRREANKGGDKINATSRHRLALCR